MPPPASPVPRGLFRRVPILSGLAPEAADALERLAERREYPEGAVILSEAEPGEALFVLARGRVKVVLHGESGREVILSTFTRPGDVFGEMALLDDEPRSATVVAMAPSTLLVLPRSVFRAQVDRHPSIAIQVMTELSRRLRRADAVIGDLALLDVLGRLAAKLRALAAAEGEETEGGVLVRQRPTQAELAAMIGASRETVSRALSELARRGELVVTGRRLLLRRGPLLWGGGAPPAGPGAEAPGRARATRGPAGSP